MGAPGGSDRQGRRARRLLQAVCAVAGGLAAAVLAAPRVAGRPFASCPGVGGPSRLNRRKAACRSNVAAAAASTGGVLSVIAEQGRAGAGLRDLGRRLEGERFEETALDGKIVVTVNGHQEPQTVRVDEGALEAAGGLTDLSGALLAAMQGAHDKSREKTRDGVWKYYRENPVLLDAPLSQIGHGGVVDNLWCNVTKTDETVRLATELFDKFDEDNDGYWNLQETSNVQKATEGSDMQEESFTALLIAAAPNGGRNLTEEDLKKGLSKEQVIQLYTDGNIQRQLGFVLNVEKDHELVFKTNQGENPELQTQAPSAEVSPNLD